MADALCRALRGIKTVEDGEAVWKMPGDELTLESSEAEALRDGGFLEILASDAPAEGGEQAEGKPSRRGR